ncbi:MAG: VCBS repeat-containing protein [Verrucomicrobiota bacterium]
MKRFVFVGGLLWWLGCASTQAVINPALQPDVYYERYDNVLVLELKALEPESGILQCRVVEAIKGTAPPEGLVSITFAGELLGVVREKTASGQWKVGDQFPVFAGKPSRRKSQRQVRLYLDEFFVGEVREIGDFVVGLSQEMELDPEGNRVNTLAGIYTGMTTELIRMLRHMREDIDFYPRKAYVKFQPDRLILEVNEAIEGVAMYDLNGDGLEDLIACSPAGDRIIQQVEPMKFVDVSEAFGVATASVSCSLADFDADGLSDVLFGSRLFRGTFAETFTLVEVPQALALPAGATLKSASFVELNGDGYPDVLASLAGGGLRAFLNPGGQEGGFREVSESLHLPQEGNGYFSVGDWNGDLQTDLFYAVEQGLLLVQDKQGIFQKQEHDIDFNFRTGLDTYGETGAGVFMPTYLSDQMDLVIPIEKDWLIVTNRDGVPTDITAYGNEISEGSDFHLATVYADLNVDGYMDLYTVADQGKENRYIINRGYGSYMHSKVHVDEKPLFKGPAHASGGRALAVGDANEDGAPDLLIGNAQGQLFLIVNETLSMRQEGDLLKKDERRLLQVRVCSVRVLGPKGVVGARVRLLNEQGEVVARKDIGTNLATGCRSPDQVNLAVREPGPYRVQVIYADGHQREWEVDLGETRRVSLVAERGDQKVSNDVWK